MLIRPLGVRPIPKGVPPIRETHGDSGRPARILAALLLVALALRPQVVGIGPLLPAIRTDLGVSHGAVGLLGSIPVLCMGVFAPLGPLLARRLGTRGAVAACVGAIVVFGLMRAAAPGIVLIIVLTFGIGLGMGVAGPILPMVVRLRMPLHPALGTGAYAAGIVMGGTLAAAASVAIAALLGDWRAALLTFSAAGVVSLGAWLLLVPGDRPAAAPAEPLRRLPWGRRIVWLLGVLFALQGILFYGSVSWLASIHLEHGWSDADAGSLVALLNAAVLFGAVTFPVIADRVGTRRQQLTAAATVSLLGVLGIATLPAAAAAWATLLGLGLGSFFPMVLTLPVDVADHPSEVGATAALMLLVGYALSSLGPVVLGVARDVTGDFTASVWLLVAVAATMLPLSWSLTERRLRAPVVGQT
jgi:CP family cyanate transporter-like MFS transporter